MDIDSEQRDTPVDGRVTGGLKLENDDDGRAVNAETQDLERGLLLAPGNHQPDVHALGHPVARQTREHAPSKRAQTAAGQVFR